MRKVLIIAWNALLRLFRDRKALLTLLLMPMVLIGILGAALGSLMEGRSLRPFDVIVVGAEQPIGQILVDEVLASDRVAAILHTAVASDLDAARAAVERGEAVAVISLPATFSADVLAGRSATIALYADPGQPTEAAIVQQIVQSFAERVSTVGLASRFVGWTEAQRLAAEIDAGLPRVTEATAGARPVRAMQYYAAAMAVMFMVMTAFSRAGDILRERDDGTLARILTSPTSRATLIAGQTLGNMAVLLAQFAILMLGTHLLYQVDWGNGWAALLIGTAFSAAAAGIGTAAAGLFRDARAADAATGAVGLVFGALSGAMIPLYQFPEGLRLVARFIPNYWALQGFLDQMAGLGSGYLWLPVALLVAIGAAAASVGAWRLASR